MGRKLLKKGETPDQFHTQLYDKITKIEAQVLQRIQKLKTNSKSYVCQHFNMASPECEPFNQNVNYYDKFWKRFLLNEIGKQNVLQFREQLQAFSKKLSKIESLFEQWGKQLQPIIKTRRKNSRTDEAERFFCRVCSKGYKDQETLMLHTKIKHRREEEAEHLKKENSEDQIYEQDNEED